MSNLQSILYELKPCDLSSPYIFISYSSLDSELVWRDVREFQRRGYNVWLDEKNLDKTKPSWREDAINAIEDMECELVVFYVSANSLRSDACYQELSKTVDERTRAMHFGPVKFIAVDAEQVGDITAFAQKVYSTIRRSSLDKGERGRQALALNGFMRDFFNSNNEKVRIHPKNEANRKIDYYDDIIASFPDITRVFEPDETSEEEPDETSEEEPDETSEEEPDETSEEEPDETSEGEPDETSEEEPDETSEEEPDETSEEEPDETSEEEPDETSEEEPDETSDEEPDDVTDGEADWFTKAESGDGGQWEQKIWGKREVRETTIRKGTLEIPMGYTKIQIKLRHSMYWGNYFIEKLILPDSLEGLNTAEFRHCSYLKAVQLPKYLTRIESEAFQDCTSLKEVVIPGNVKEIGAWAFKNCSSLRKVVLPEGLKLIDTSAFKGCSSLKEVHLPPNLQTMNMSAFQGCSSLKEIRIPGSVKKIPISAFEGCLSMKKIIIEEGVEEIESAFEKCGTARVQVWVPDSVTVISSIAFSRTSPTFHCNKGTYAETYAKSHSYRCVRI